MRHLILKTSIMGAFALGFLALGAPAKAASPLSLDKGEARLILAQDDENMAVEEDLRPDEVPEAMEGKDEPMMEPKMEKEGGSDANIEDEMIDKIGPGAE